MAILVIGKICMSLTILQFGGLFSHFGALEVRVLLLEVQ
jgi:hypothetical protein